MEKEWKKLSYWVELVIGVCCGLLIYGLLHLLEDTIKSTYDSGFHISILIHVCIELAVVIVVTLFLKIREGSQKSIKDLNSSTKELHQSMELKTDAAMLSQQITNNYYKIISHPYKSLITEYIKEVQKSQDKKDLVSLVEGISEARKKLIVEQNEFWRVLVERFVYSHYKSIDANKYILSLETYCNLLIDCIKLNQKVAADTNKTLVVISFTNATPADWFAEREVIGNPLRDYAAQMKQTIVNMKAEQNIFRRFVVCKSDEFNTEENKEEFKGTMVGFSNFSEVKNDWVECVPEKKRIYLNDYHSDNNLAEILSLQLPDLKFYHNCTEFVFVGFKENKPGVELDEKYLKDISDIDWRWCFSGGYTQSNVNISASFIDLSNPSDAKKLIVDVPNKLNIIDRETMIERKRLEISFKDFPKFILTDNEKFASIIQFNNLIPLAEKWEIASEIWHNQDESKLMELFFRKHIPKSSKILDAACGTGQHSFILSNMKDMNYKLTASDKDNGNLEIFKKKAKDLSLNIDHKIADWNKLTTDLDNEKFDVINCLGTSIPYYISWKENENVYSFTNEGLKNVLSEFKKSLNTNGKLIIGLSRHINKKHSQTSIKFRPQRIEASKIGIPNADYEMIWDFNYDWSEKRKRTWNCHIKNNLGDDYSFKLISHLFDIEDLKDLSSEVFGSGNVELDDFHSSSYDMFLICKNG